MLAQIITLQEVGHETKERSELVQQGCQCSSVCYQIKNNSLALVLRESFGHLQKKTTECGRAIY